MTENATLKGFQENWHLANSTYFAEVTQTSHHSLGVSVTTRSITHQNHQVSSLPPIVNTIKYPL
jgi:hypothetical protein